MYQVFIETHGSPLLIAHSQAELEQANERFWDNYYQRLNVDASPKEIAASQAKKEHFVKTASALPPEYHHSKDFEIFFTKGEGYVIIGDLKANIIDRLTAESLSEADARQLFEWIAVSTLPPLAEYLINTYPIKNLVFPIDDQGKRMSKILIMHLAN